MKTNSLIAFVVPSLLALRLVAAESIDPALLQAKLDAKLKDIHSCAANSVIVDAVKAQNAKLPPEYAAMTQEKWESASILDPFVRAFTKNAAAEFLKSKKGDLVVEAFLSAADGLKVAFLSKTSNWNHKGKPKHDVPMAGKMWQGPLEVDESSGIKQIQIAVPVSDGDKPIGSLVVGISVTKLSR